MDGRERCGGGPFTQGSTQASEQQWCWVNTARVIPVVFGYHLWKRNDLLRYLLTLGHKNVEAKCEALTSRKPGSCYLWAGRVKIGKSAQAGLKNWRLQMWSVAMFYWVKFTSAWGRTAKPLLGLVACTYCLFIRMCWPAMFF